MNRKVYFILPNKTHAEVKIDDRKSNFRAIANQLTHFLPEEKILIVDENNRLISKYQDRLQEGKSYTLINSDELYRNWNQLGKEYQKESQSKEQLQKELNTERHDREINRREKLALEKQITDLEDRIKMLNATGQKEIQQQQLETQKKLDDLKKQLLSVQKENEYAKDQEQQLKKDSQEREYQLQVQIEQLTNGINQANLENQQLSQQILNFKQENEQYKYQLQQYHNYCTNLSSQSQQQIQQLQFQLQQMQSESDQKLEDQNRIINNLNRDIADKKKKQSAFEEEIDKLTAQNTKLKNQEQTLQNTLQSEQKKLNKVIEEQGDELNTLQNKIRNLTFDLQKKERLIEKMKQESQQLQQQFFTDRQQPQISSAQFEQVSKQLQEQRKQNDKLEEEIEKQKNNLFEIEQEKTKCTGQINILKNEKNDLNRQIDQLKQQIELVEKEKISTLRIQKENSNEQERRLNNQIEELNQKIQTDLQKSIDQKNVLGQEIERLNKEIQKLLSEKQELENEANQTRKRFQEQILDFDQKMLDKENELKAFQNSSQTANYDMRIRRLVESIPRDYAQDIEFSIETMMRERAKCDDFQKKYPDQTKKVTFQIVKVTINRKEADQLLYNISDQNFLKLIQMQQFAEPMTITGTQSFNAYESSDTALERIYFFKCTNCPKMKEFEGKVFGIKECKKGDLAELGSLETAQSNCLPSLIAQDMLETFIKDLKAKNFDKVPKDLKFQNSYIIITEKHFKQVFQEEYQRQQLVNPVAGFKFIMELIKHLNDQSSDDLYSDIRQFQLDKQRNNKKVAGADGASTLKSFIENLEIAQKPNILAEFNKLERNVINKGFDNFIDFLGGIDKDMPLKTYYAMQQIDIVDGFKKYNGGHMKFEVDELGKFFSAFSYYSIIKSKGQICVSHIQGVKNILYDPLVSTYDGFLDKLDQGYNEIRTFESKFLSEQNINKGVEYLKVLGIKWK